jgi:hypothetical protein
MNEKHIEFVQNIITRMNSNSFMLKGWQILIVSALFALSANDANLNFIYITYLPSIAFWILDGFYLRQERLFRKLYNSIIDPKSKIPKYSMDTSIFNESVETLSRTCFSISVLLFHGPIFLIINITEFN